MGVRLGFRLAPRIWATIPLRFQPSNTDPKLAPRSIWELIEALALGFGMVAEWLVLSCVRRLRATRTSALPPPTH
jgi:hypothetical protein